MKSGSYSPVAFVTQMFFHPLLPDILLHKLTIITWKETNLLVAQAFLTSKIYIVLYHSKTHGWIRVTDFNNNHHRFFFFLFLIIYTCMHGQKHWCFSLNTLSDVPKFCSFKTVCYYYLVVPGAYFKIFSFH